MGHRYTPKQDALVMADYEANLSMNELAEKYARCRPAIRASIVRAGGRIRTRKEAGQFNPGRPPLLYGINERFFEAIDTPEKAWLLGLLAADGCVTGGGRSRVTLTLQSRDRECLETVARVLGFGGPIEDKTYNGYPRSSLKFSCKRIAADLMRHGVGPAKSLTLEPWCGPDALMPHYFRGLVDGDGWVLKSRKEKWDIWRVGLCGTLAVVKAFAEFVANRTDSRAGPSKTKANLWAVGYDGVRIPRQVAELLYWDAPAFLARKKRVADELMALPV